jgi:transposase, IS5 family
VLEDDTLFARVRANLEHRHRLTTTRGRHATPVEVILHLLVIKHLHNWSDAETRDRVADSLVLRWFTRVYFQRVPDDKTLLKWANLIQGDTLHALNDRVLQLALDLRITAARKLRVDTGVVQTSIHHPTDSSLLSDSVRILGRCLKRAKRLLPHHKARAFRVPSRTMGRGLQQIHRASSVKVEPAAEQR